MDPDGFTGRGGLLGAVVALGALDGGITGTVLEDGCIDEGLVDGSDERGAAEGAVGGGDLTVDGGVDAGP